MVRDHDDYPYRIEDGRLDSLEIQEGIEASFKAQWALKEKACLAAQEAAQAELEVFQAEKARLEEEAAAEEAALRSSIKAKKLALIEAAAAARKAVIDGLSQSDEYAVTEEKFSFGGPTNREIREGYWENPIRILSTEDLSLVRINPDRGWTLDNVRTMGRPSVVLEIAHSHGYHGGYVTGVVAVGLVSLPSAPQPEEEKEIDPRWAGLFKS